MARLKFIHPSGGVFYHYIAFRYRHSIWKPFRERLNEWLSNWKTDNELIVIGPSAGYCIDSSFFRQFEKVTAYDVDTLSKYIFTARNRGLADLIWKRDDLLSPDGKEFQVEMLLDTLKANPRASILFSNILGQLPAAYPNATDNVRYERWKQSLFSVLHGRSWASFHDCLSGKLLPMTNGVHEIPYEDVNSTAKIVQQFYQSPNEEEVELLDHDVHGFFVGMPRVYMNWELIPGQFNLIEAVKSDLSA